MVYYTEYKCPFGDMLLASTGSGLCRVEFDAANAEEFFAYIKQFGDCCRSTDKNAYYTNQLDEYFDGKLKHFDIKLDIKGTDFQRKVWNELIRIPYGEVRTYGDIARFIGSWSRAVGQAVGKNPVPIVVPCHRVVSSQGIGGFGGQTEGRNIDIKKNLLIIEKFDFNMLRKKHKDK
jgi:O-6-methylguanine DNA methyltransferase